MSVGRKIDNRYIIEDLISKGRRSRVYRVSQLNLPGIHLVLKEMVISSSQPARVKAARFLFSKEVARLVKLKHPGIAKFYEGFNVGGRFYLVSEPVEGTSLAEFVTQRRDKPLTGRQASVLIHQLADTVIYLNSLPEKMRVYKDLNPENIMITPQKRLKIVDFGTARFFGEEEDNYRSVSGFNSPEVVSGGEYDEKSDVYALGAIMYFMVTGKKPGEFEDKIPPPHTLNPRLDKHFSRLISKCLAPREERVENVSQFRALLGIARGRSLEDEIHEIFRQREESFARQRKKQRLRRALMVLAFILLLIPPGYWGAQKLAFYACSANCRMIGRALERYAVDHQGRYPPKLSDLKPRYLKIIFPCPAAFKDTYSRTYRAYNFQGFNYFKFYCEGKHHAWAGGEKNYPRYNSYDLLLTSPKPGLEAGNPVENMVEAYALDREGKYSLAVQKLRNLTVIDQETLRKEAGIEKYLVFWNMSRILRKAGKTGEASDKLKVAAELLQRRSFENFDPASVELMIEDLKKFIGKKEAREFFDSLAVKYVVQSEMPDVRVVMRMTDIYCQKNWKNRGVKFLRRYLSKCPSEDNNLVIAEINRMKGNKRKARTYYRAYLRQEGQKIMSDRADRMLEKLR